ncbi:YbhB/YbcL family Raf kinase inhibitor-like protein [Bifidobacterium xylocopae]|uniref:YbhB/YbcL family Raf kinase inhibitor-like protein n=1 Tax=Bifidobacterium xylocopae TaxID=2493119 RepID=A0A366KCJ5_9BIFI|nr:YbhB/YbcL family Raf kinase inhibitor-like protein [Bifidobacterium xylocopae]RBP99465.1 YbhB/YbcL family Raf kinase inhibitor-like protein [Bifidobacterium xylocopae]
MRIATDFDIIPDEYAKRAGGDRSLDDTPVVSFPFMLEDLPEGAAFLSWELVDPDSIPVCGFQWIHWSLANLPLGRLVEDPASGAVHVPADLSRRLSDLAPGATQGRTSQASKFVGGTNPALTCRYNGPTPPDTTHDYVLRVWATGMPLPGLEEGFWLNALERAVHDNPAVLAQAEAWLPAEA